MNAIANQALGTYAIIGGFIYLVLLLMAPRKMIIATSWLVLCVYFFKWWLPA